jgi:hypothetical protein
MKKDKMFQLSIAVVVGWLVYKWWMSRVAARSDDNIAAGRAASVAALTPDGRAAYYGPDPTNTGN